MNFFFFPILTDGEGKELNNSDTPNLQHNCTEYFKNQPQQLPSGIPFIYEYSP